MSRIRGASGDVPAVSIVLPFHATEPAFLREAIESVRRQTYPDWELLLVDDGADPATAAAAREATGDRTTSSRVRFLRHADGGNRGLSASRNLALQAARGRYVAFLDADDVWLPSKLEEQTAALERHDPAGMLYGNALYWFGWTGRAEDRERDFRPELGVPTDEIMEPPGPLPAYLRGRAAVPCTNSVLARREVVVRVGGFEEDFRGLYEDQVFYAKMCLAAPVVADARCWDRYRQHGDSMSARANREAHRAARRRYLVWLLDHLDRRNLDHPELRRAIDRELRRLDHPRLTRAARLGRKALRRLLPGGAP